MSLLISGSLVYDHIMDFPDSFRNHILPDQIHLLNVCFTVDKLERSFGGTAGNIAYTVKLLGGEPTIVSVVGSDGQEYLEYLRRVGVNTEYIRVGKRRPTAAAYITTDIDDNQITAFFNGPLAQAQEADFTPLKDKIRIALISPTQKDVMQTHLRRAKEAGWLTVFDPGQQIPVFKPEELQSMIDQADVIIGNDYEMRLLQERTGWDTKKILSVTDMLITTLGDQGSVVTTSDGQAVRVSACPPRSADDPTGAGDAYRAGFFTGYARGFPFKTCAQIGSVAASYAIETYGTQAHQFSLREFKERYQKTYSEEVNL
ncbi:MAG: carbohydrate kinase family protein [Candidatus Magasanikbacteria bacterium]|nr:carbohydrate kinase family protein [Candidatus Magasanikbacteria bacterium]